MTDRFDRCIQIVLHHEGGYVNDPYDRGRATNFGISLRFAIGANLDIDSDNDDDIDAKDIATLTKEQAIEIYRQHFWTAVKGDEMPIGVDLMMLDCGINQGPRVARRLLQASIGTTPDGIIGPITLRALKRSKPTLVVREMAARRMVHYSKCREADRYILGWARRLMHVHETSCLWVRSYL